MLFKWCYAACPVWGGFLWLLCAPFLLYFFPCSVVSPTLTPEAFDLRIPAFNTDWMHVIHPRHSGYQYPPQKYPRTNLWIPERNTLENSLVMLLFDFKSWKYEMWLMHPLYTGRCVFSVGSVGGSERSVNSPCGSTVGEVWQASGTGAKLESLIRIRKRSQDAIRLSGRQVKRSFWVANINGLEILTVPRLSRLEVCDVIHFVSE